MAINRLELLVHSFDQFFCTCVDVSMDNECGTPIVFYLVIH